MTAASPAVAAAETPRLTLGGHVCPGQGGRAAVVVHHAQADAVAWPAAFAREARLQHHRLVRVHRRLRGAIETLR